MPAARNRIALALTIGSLGAILLGVSACDGSKTPAANAKVKSRETIRKTTQNVLKLSDALAQGGTLATGGGELGPSEGYLGATAQAYRSSVAKLAAGQVQQMMQIYDIQNNGPVKNYEEFMEFIIKKDKPDGIQLPMLPYYQEYAFDEANKQLVVVEFAEKKKTFEAQNK